MGELVLVTFDWVPEMPRGLVRDLRVRWALEEAGLPYRVDSVPFGERDKSHFAHQPFGQVPWLTDGDLSIFESGAILLHLGGLSGRLLPIDPQPRSLAIQWMFAALNSVEMASLPWALLVMSRSSLDSQGGKFLTDFLDLRLGHVDQVLSRGGWLAGDFSVADILMADVLRVVERFGGLEKHPACRAYLARATSRPAFAKAHADQLAHFAAADAKRKDAAPGS